MDKISRMARLALLCGGVGVAGCFSLDSGHFVRANQEHVLVGNYGWYLFNSIPLACGNASKDRWFPWVLFRDDVTQDKIQGRFMDHAGGRPVHDLVYTANDSVMLEIPSLDLPLPIPYILSYHELQLSGTIDADAPRPNGPAPAKGGSL